MSRMISATNLNPVLFEPGLPSHLSVITQGQGTQAENLIEYAGRLCYRSIDRMGHSPTFISERAAEGHLDILEHSHATLEFRDHGPLGAYFLKLQDGQGALRYYESTLFQRTGYITASLRSWYAFFEAGYFTKGLKFLKAVSPVLFSPFTGEPVEPWEPVEHDYLTAATRTPAIAPSEHVTLLATNLILHPEMMKHCYATFLVEGISRACSHQFVRHRLASFSQESQRYVDLRKGGWGAVVPPSIQENQAALMELEHLYSKLEESYAYLRKLGIRKEDARYLLPNATETRLVVTMGFPAWKHFLKLRLDKAAQWEIRQVAQEIDQILGQIAPDYFRQGEASV